ncbi:hypothetical protein F4604DRAFT_1879257 [Suillus subluteus]|nr:hypothetical protein F4604DRAFT_1879257 [Suillus subluteus]
MAFRKISDDVKRAAIHLYEQNLLNLQDILDCCGFSQWTWYRVLRLWRDTGDVANHPRGVRGCVRRLECEDIEYLLELVHDNPDYFLDELVSLARTNCFISIHFTTKLKCIALERNEELRAAFVARMSQYDATEIGFIDEVSKDEWTLGRHYGRSSRGKPLLTLDGIVACTAVEGSMMKELFLEWLEFTVSDNLLVTEVLCISRPVECPCDGQCFNSPWCRDSRTCRPFWSVYL